MTTIAAHFSVEALRDRYVSSADVMEARHFQTIWLLAKGHGVGEVAGMTSFGPRWIEQLVVRYNSQGPDAPGDLRRRNGSTAREAAQDEVMRHMLRKIPTTIVFPAEPGIWRASKDHSCVTPTT